MVALRAGFDTLRSLAFGSISGTYAKVGTAFGFPARMIRIINNTDGDMLFSDDGVNDKLFIPAGSYVLYDVTANVQPNTPFSIAKNTQFWVKQSTAPTKNSVYIEFVYGIGG